MFYLYCYRNALICVITSLKKIAKFTAMHCDVIPHIIKCILYDEILHYIDVGNEKYFKRAAQLLIYIG